MGGDLLGRGGVGEGKGVGGSEEGKLKECKE